MLSNLCKSNKYNKNCVKIILKRIYFKNLSSSFNPKLKQINTFFGRKFDLNVTATITIWYGKIFITANDHKIVKSKKNQYFHFVFEKFKTSRTITNTTKTAMITSKMMLIMSVN
ncbi:hypothetical protein BpHYR1_031374 [Brachionus plicatilis]|uniref:Uncharacterized protein n=1 Tax=Brachionus plicatilis TaxID=10195 RepID=A0A3M7SU37_BRAPC|nr:hypothetical protein BpHYR1_031374 [Brachionus plicatilis]